jgi:flagellar basal body-associated protein FliL
MQRAENSEFERGDGMSNAILLGLIIGIIILLIGIVAVVMFIISEGRNE